MNTALIVLGLILIGAGSFLLNPALSLIVCGLLVLRWAQVREEGS